MQLDVEVSPPAFVRELLNNFEHLLMEFHSIQIKEFISLSLRLEHAPSRPGNSAPPPQMINGWPLDFAWVWTDTQKVMHKISLRKLQNWAKNDDH